MEQTLCGTLAEQSLVAAIGLLVLVSVGPHCLTTEYAAASPPLALATSTTDSNTLALAASVSSTAAPLRGAMSAIALAKQDPWGLARQGKTMYERQIRDYTCVFLKQERISGKLRDVEEIAVRYREDPKAVYMVWRRNADQAKRALYVDNPEFVNDKGEKLARVEPAGALIRLIVSDIMMPIHGKRAMASSRRSIDEFGFYSTLGLLDRFNHRALEAGVLDLRYEGEGSIDGRPTYVIVRHLPYTGEDGVWPDAKMVMHLDQEWLLPTAVYSYADSEGRRLLGSYILTKVKLNPGLNDGAFKF